MKVLTAIVILCAIFCADIGAVAQNKASRAAGKSAATVAGRTECTASVGLCVTVPASWQRLGDIFNDLGFVVAEPHSGADQATWPQLNVAAIDVPAQSNGARPSLDSLVELVLTPDGSFTSSETMQRSRLLLNGSNAEIIRVKLHGESVNGETIEEVALIEGDEGLVYSIALRCAPQDFSRLEPIFQKAAHSWRIKQTPSQTKQDSEKK
jgi:hypothetical protein